MDVLLAAFALAGAEHTAAVAWGRLVGHTRIGTEGFREHGLWRIGIEIVEGGVHDLEADAAGARGVVFPLWILVSILRVG